MRGKKSQVFYPWRREGRGEEQLKANSLQLGQPRKQQRFHTGCVLQSYNNLTSHNLILPGEEEPLLLIVHAVQQAHSVRTAIFKICVQIKDSGFFFFLLLNEPEIQFIFTVVIAKNENYL